jgi:hypothetical protein
MAEHHDDEEEHEPHKRKRRRKGGTAEGRMAHHRLDGRPRRARGGESNPPYSTAADMKGPIEDVAGTHYSGTRAENNAELPGEKSEKFKSGGHLMAHERQNMPKSEFALPGKGKGPKGAGAGSYPIPDERHARAALSRASANASPAEQATIRRKVHARFPEIGES